MSYFDLRKNPPAPFWSTLILGILALSMSISGLIKPWGPFWLIYYNIGEQLFSFVAPILILIEAYLYWRFRRKNSYTALTWIQIGLTAVALTTPFLLESKLRMEMPEGRNNRINFIFKSVFVQVGIFTILLFISQAIFLILLVRFRSRPLPFQASDPRNLLDDLIP
jgi:hypothetical protein